MKKLGKDKIALFLACASVLNGKTSATQNFKSGQIVAAVGVGTQAKKGISVGLALLN